ncbi:glycosyltransferase family 4 protein [Deferrisoma palaeochoriense]
MTANSAPNRRPAPPILSLHLSDQSRADLGGQQSLLGLVAGLKARGHRPLVALPGLGTLSSALDAHGVPWISGPLGPGSRGPRGLARRISFLRREIRRTGASVVHADRPLSAFAAALACRRTGARAAWHVRVREPDPLFDRFLPRVVDRIVATSRGVLERFPPAVRNRVAVVYNGLDLERFRPAGPPEAPPLVGFLGQWIPLKGVDVFLDAARIVAGRVPGVRFLVVGSGSGEYTERLRTLAGPLGERVEFAPPTARPEGLYPRLTALVAPTREPGEGFGRVAAEAMACGVPVVASRVAGLSEVVADGETGLLVPPGDPAALAKALVNLLRNPAEAAALGRAGRARAERLFSLEAHVRAMEEVFREALTPALSPKGGEGDRRQALPAGQERSPLPWWEGDRGRG